VDTIEEHITVVVPTKTDSNPWPDLEAAPLPPTTMTIDPPPFVMSIPADHAAIQRQCDSGPLRNPFIFRTMLSNPLRLLTRGRDTPAVQPQLPISSIPDATPASQTRQQHSSGSDTRNLVSSRDSEPWAAVDSGTRAARSSDRGSKGAAAKVQTRVWSDDDEERALEMTTHPGNDGRDVEGSATGGAAGGGAYVRVETRIARSERRM
jgi:hypothetical protein